MNSIKLSSVFQKAKKAFHEYGWQYLGSVIISAVLYTVMSLIIAFLIANGLISLFVMPGGVTWSDLIVVAIKFVILVIILKIAEYLLNQGSQLLMIDSGSGKTPKKQVLLGFLKVFSNKKLFIGTIMIGLLKILLAELWFIVPVVIECFLMFTTSSIATTVAGIVFFLMIAGYIIMVVRMLDYKLATYIYYRSLLNNKPVGYLKALELSADCISGHRIMLIIIDLCFVVFVGFVNIVKNLLASTFLKGFTISILDVPLNGAEILVIIAIIIGAIFTQALISIFEYMILKQRAQNHEDKLKKINHFKRINEKMAQSNK